MLTKKPGTHSLRAVSASVLFAGLIILSGCGRAADPTKDPTMQTSVCATQMKQFANAKVLWAQQNNKSDADTPTMADIQPFIRCETNCPGGGTYTLGKVGELPKCSIAAHQAMFEQRLKEQQAAAAAQ